MVTIRVTAHRLELQAPYHPVLPFRSKQIGGKWMGPEIGWTFPLVEEPALRALCQDIWAVDGSAAALESTIDLHVTVNEHAAVRTVFLAYELPIYLVGREIAASLANRKAARPGRGIRFLSGRPRCITTPSTWSTVIPNGSVFLIRNVPEAAISRFRNAIGDAGQMMIKAMAQSARVP
jgi:hypothetical protein